MKNTNTRMQERRRFFAVISLGKGRWYWVVWPSLAEIQAAEEPLLHVGEGTASTKLEAVEQALKLAGNPARWIAGKYARSYYRGKTGLTGGRRPARPAEGTHTLKTDEFLYRDAYEPESQKWVPVPHRVVRRTAKFVFIEQQPYAPGDLTGSWFDRDLPTFRLNRKMLERDGYAFVPPTAFVEDADEIYFSEAYTQVTETIQIHCLQVLDLSWPCTEAEVKAAYRKLVKTAHPDGGGSQESFLALQEAYEQALELFRRHADESGTP